MCCSIFYYAQLQSCWPQALLLEHHLRPFLDLSRRDQLSCSIASWRRHYRTVPKHSGGGLEESFFFWLETLWWARLVVYIRIRRQSDPNSPSGFMVNPKKGAMHLTIIIELKTILIQIGSIVPLTLDPRVSVEEDEKR